MTLRHLMLLILLIGINIINAQPSSHTTAKAYYDKAVAFESQNIDSTLFYVEKAYQNLKSRDTTHLLFADILNQYGRVYYLKQDFKTAYAYFERVYELSLSIGEEANAFKVKVNMAICNRQRDEPEKALTDFFDVVTYYEKTAPDDINLGKTYFNIADLYFLNNQHENAEVYYKKSEPFFEAIPRFQYQLITNRIGNFNNFNLKKSLDIIEAFENSTPIDSVPKAIRASLFNNMGQTMVRSENYQKALFYNFASLRAKKDTGVKFGLANQYNNIADVYIKTKTYPLAIHYLDTALSLASSHRQKFQILKNLQLAHEKTQNFKKSLDYANRYIALKDSLNEVLTQKEIASLGIDYDVKTKDEFINKVKNLSTTYKTIILVLVILSLFVLGVLYNKNKTAKLEVIQLQNELEKYKTNQVSAEKSSKPSKLVLNNKRIINLDKLLYIKSSGHYIELYLVDESQPELDRKSLSKIIEELPGDRFIRIHKSYIVNMEFIKIINSKELMLTNGVWLKLSRTYKDELKARLHLKDEA
ncbi:LytTR family transcriptional regulator [Psychroflexus sp. YR1-1]|uniref:LytTR family transcriptional regulator n=1 Tax=Psychroflexus aurantiacus TaxID=2709310 RepID=A0A6B3QXY3_9FLAO|nr:LytTR family transcriptional regulator [Psychroflexus aurantiacus]NEV93016.1 LytTR family transcriptional regulator [Psychroflexus aurantiacus]